MTNTRKFINVGIAFFFMLAGVSLLHADVLSDIQMRKKIRIAIDLSVPPFGQLDGQLQAMGSDVEAAQKLAKDMGVALEIVQVTGPNRIPFLMTGKADIVMASFSITPERAKVVTFTLPYGASEFVVAAAKSMDIKSIDDLNARRVGVPRGSMQDNLLTPLVSKNTKMVRFDDDATVLAAILSGQVDVLCSPHSLISALIKQNPSKNIEVKFSLKVIPYAIGIKKNETQLENFLNKWVKDNWDNGELARIYEKNTGSPLADLSQFYK